MTHQNAVELIISIMNKKLNVSSEKIISENYDIPLTGNMFNFSSVDLVYLLFETEKVISKKFAPEELVDYRFNTINEIAKLIADKTVV